MISFISVVKSRVQSKDNESLMKDWLCVESNSSITQTIWS